MNNSNINLNKSFDASEKTLNNESLEDRLYKDQLEQITISHTSYLESLKNMRSLSDPTEYINKLTDFILILLNEIKTLKKNNVSLKYHIDHVVKNIEKKDLPEMEKRITANLTKDTKDINNSIQNLKSRVTTLEQSPPPILNNSSSELAKAVPKVKIHKEDFKEKLRTVITKQPMTMNAICDSLYKTYNIYIHRNSKESVITIHTLRNYLYELQNSKFICIALTNKENKPSRHNPLLI